MLKNTLILIISWWILWAFVQSWMLITYGFPFDVAVADSIVANSFLALLCAGTTYMIRYYRPGPSKSMYLFLGIIVFSAFNTWITIQVLQELFLKDDIYIYFLKHSEIPRFIISLLMLSLAVVFGWVFQYQNAMKEDQTRLAEVSKEAKEAELANLIQKIQPHFLFNTLNSVNTLVQTNPDKAQLMIQQLSDFLRSSINKDKNQFIQLKEEISQLELYFNIEKVRFGNRLSTSIVADKDALEKMIPPLLLQPLVENAIKFGLYDTLGDIEILVKVNYDKPYLILSVTNPYDEQSSYSKKGTGFGLSALQKRLYLLYGRTDLFSFTRQNGSYTATLKLPVE